MDGTNEKELWPEKAKEIYFSFVPKNHRECSQVTGMFVDALKYKTLFL